MGKRTQKLQFIALPGIILLLLLDIFPGAYLLIAFKAYSFGKSFLYMRNVGLENFKLIFMNNYTWHVLGNTVIISSLKTIGLLLSSMLLALKVFKFKLNGGRLNLIILIMLIPHFMSWTMIAGIASYTFRLGGELNKVIATLGGREIFFLGNPQFMQFLVILLYVWKEVGFYALIILIGLFRIPLDVIDAARIDGASEWDINKQIILPLCLTVIFTLFVIDFSGILDAGFEEIFLLYSPHTFSSLDIIDTYIYRKGIIDSNYGLAAALSLIKLVGAIIASAVIVGTKTFLSHRNTRLAKVIS